MKKILFSTLLIAGLFTTAFTFTGLDCNTETAKGAAECLCNLSKQYQKATESKSEKEMDAYTLNKQRVQKEIDAKLEANAYTKEDIEKSMETLEICH